MGSSPPQSQMCCHGRNASEGGGRQFQNKRRKTPRGYTPNRGELPFLQGNWLYFRSVFLSAMNMHILQIKCKEKQSRIVCTHLHFFSQTYSVALSIYVRAPATRLSHLLPFPSLPISRPHPSPLGAASTAPHTSSFLTCLMSMATRLPPPLPKSSRLYPPC